MVNALTIQLTLSNTSLIIQEVCCSRLLDSDSPVFAKQAVHKKKFWQK
jgi:hypothetical protein